MTTKQNFLIITHTFTTGPSQELKNFLIKQGKLFAFLEHPFSYNKRQKRSRMTFFRAGKRMGSYRGIKIKGPDLFYFLKDFFYTFYFVQRAKNKYQICIAADNLNAFAAFFLKKIRYVDKVIYWTIDYTPQRFENKLLNRLYHGLDRFCCYHSDLLWNSSARMQPARQVRGVNLKRCAPVLIVHDGCHFKKIKRLEPRQDTRFKLVFMGHLIKKKGVDFVLRALPALLRLYPQITLTIIGTGEQEEALKQLAKKLGLHKQVIFKGFVESDREVEAIIASCGIALAPYLPDPTSYTFFSDVGKVKIYLACGLPVLITDVPEIASLLQKTKAGLIFQYTRKNFTEKISHLLNDHVTYLQYRKNAITFAQDMDWERLFTRVIQKSLTSINSEKNR